MINVSTWIEFLNAIKTSGAEVNVTADIKADTPFKTDVDIVCSKIHGNGFSVVGMMVDDCTLGIDGNLTVDNLNFVNFTSKGTGSFQGFFYAQWDARMLFENCRFNGINQATNFLASNSSNKSKIFRNCSFAIRGYNSNLSSASGNYGFTFESCHFMLYGTWQNMRLNFFNSSKLDGGTITGFSSASDSTLSKSVINAVISGAVSLDGTDSIINADKISGAVSGSINAVTSEQMVDIEYLNSIGFEVFPDVDSTE